MASNDDVSRDNSDRDRPDSDPPSQVSRRRFLQSLGAAGVVGASGSLLAACGGGGGGSSQSSETSSKQASSGGGGPRTVTLHPKGNQMKYKETEFTVAPGEKVKLVFENTATSPSMQHNVVVLNKPPSDKIFREVGQAGAKAGASKDFVPDHPAVLAHTPLSKPGETVSVTFTAPEETGDYGYVCTYPGHWALMQGTMHVKSG